MRVLVSGPCGVGKTAVSHLLVASQPGTIHLDFDTLRTASDGISISDGCSVRYLELERCAGDLVRAAGRSVVFDVGGDTIFRPAPVDNDERREQVLGFKRTHDLEVVLLDGRRSVVRERFLGCKSREPGEFDPLWDAWTELGRPYWSGVADRIVDTSDVRLGVERDEQLLVAQVLGLATQA